jgi:hypothetical protein
MWLWGVFGCDRGLVWVRQWGLFGCDRGLVWVWQWGLFGCDSGACLGVTVGLVWVRQWGLFGCDSGACFHGTLRHSDSVCQPPWGSYKDMLQLQRIISTSVRKDSCHSALPDDTEMFNAKSNITEQQHYQYGFLCISIKVSQQRLSLRVREPENLMLNNTNSVFYRCTWG